MNEKLLPTIRAYSVSEERIVNSGMSRKRLTALLHGRTTISESDKKFFTSLILLSRYKFDPIKYFRYRLKEKIKDYPSSCNSVEECEYFIKKSKLATKENCPKNRFIAKDLADSPEAARTNYKLMRRGLNYNLIKRTCGVDAENITSERDQKLVADTIDKLYGDDVSYHKFLHKIELVQFNALNMCESLNISYGAMYCYMKQLDIPSPEIQEAVLNDHRIDDSEFKVFLHNYKSRTGSFDYVTDILISDKAADVFKEIRSMGKIEEAIQSEFYSEPGTYYSDPKKYFYAVRRKNQNPEDVVNWLRCETYYSGYPYYILAGIHSDEYFKVIHESKYTEVFTLLCEHYNEIPSPSPELKLSMYHKGAEILDSHYDTSSGMTEHEWLLKYLGSAFKPLEYLKSRANISDIPYDIIERCKNKRDCDELLQKLGPF